MSSNIFYRNQLKKFDQLLTKYPTQKDLIEGLYISAIAESFDRVRVVENIQGFTENSIRNEFVRDFKERSPFLKPYLNNKSITLTSEDQANTRDYTQRTDIGFHSNFHGHSFVIECKKLSSVESRYVNGREGKEGYKPDGLEKFIHQIYSQIDNEAAMLSFVVKGSPLSIAIGLKEKVKEFCPYSDMESFIHLPCIELEASFQSKHLRMDGTPILLYHLFFDFN